MAENGDPLLLQAFKDQVGGHFLIMEIDRDWVCKPMQSRERLFYETVPEPIKQFIPRFGGVMNVGFIRGKNGEFQYTAYPVSKSNDKSTIDDISSEYSLTEEENLRYLKCSMRTDTTRGKIKSDQKNNPWTEFRKKSLSRVLEKRIDETERHDYIVLENLTGKFKYPCVMDLKIGTRSYSDAMSEAKKQLHLERCDSTTSKAIGVRLGGMQIYNTSDQHFYYLDKYYGQSLSVEDFYKSMTDFLYSGKRYRWELFYELVKKLKELRDVIRKMDSYRFYSSSLLIMYDGDDPKEEHGPNVSLTSVGHPTSDITMSNDCDVREIDVKMIDFGNTTHRYCVKDPVQYDGPDEGYILGLTTVINTFETFHKDKQNGVYRS